MKKDNWFLRTFLNPWFVATVVLFFGGIILLFQINTYGADKNGTNGLFLWAGIISLVLMLGCAYKTVKSSRGGGKDSTHG